MLLYGSDAFYESVLCAVDISILTSPRLSKSTTHRATVFIVSRGGGQTRNVKDPLFWTAHCLMDEDFTPSLAGSLIAEPETTAGGYRLAHDFPGTGLLETE